MLVVNIVFCAGAGQLPCDQKVRYRASESGWSSLDSSWQCYYMLGTTTKVDSNSVVVVTLERNILIRLRSNCN